MRVADKIVCDEQKRVSWHICTHSSGSDPAFRLLLRLEFIAAHVEPVTFAE